MTRVVMVVLAAALCAGCAAWKTAETEAPAPPPAPAASAEKGGATPRSPESPSRAAGFVERYTGSRKLAHAVELLGKGEQQAAIKELNALCSGKAMPGVTDEALFRLALLTLKPTAERPASAQGQQLLKRLRKEYPASSWAVQSAPLLDLLSTADDLKQQNRYLKTTNQSLTRENQSLTKEINDLNKTINQLKNLDLELEQKRR